MKRIVISCLLCFVWSFATSQTEEYYAQKAELNQDVLFEENKGQFTYMDGSLASTVLFKLDVPGIDVYITETGLTYVFKSIKENEGKDEDGKKVDWEKVNVILDGATIRKENVVVELQDQQGYSNYFLSKDVYGIQGVKKYGKVTIKEVYPNIDWVFYNSKKTGFKYDFLLHAGAKVEDIKLIYQTLKKMELDETGSLILKTDFGTLNEAAPQTYYKGDMVASEYQLSSPKPNRFGGYDHLVSFMVDDMVIQDFLNSDESLIIDPELVWATLFGGNELDGPTDIDCDDEGNVWIVGYTMSTDLPLENEFQSTWTGDPDGFIIKLDSGSVINWITYFGARLTSVCVDDDGSAFVAGVDDGTMQTTVNAFQGNYGGGVYDGLIAKIGATGGVLMSTFIGGSDIENLEAIALDNAGDLLVVGNTKSNNFPVLNAFQSTISMASVFGAESDGFVSKFDASGSLLWSTFFGGSLTDAIYDVAIDEFDNIFIGGSSDSDDFPVLNAFQGTLSPAANGGVSSDGILAKFDPSGNLLWSTYMGGNGIDVITAVEIDRKNELIGAAKLHNFGVTGSNTFPVLNAWQGSYGGATSADCSLFKFENNGTLKWSTFYGGSSSEHLMSRNLIEIDGCNNIYFGITTSSDDLFQSPFCEGYSSTQINNPFRSEQLLSKFSEGGQLLGQTFFGGSAGDGRLSFKLDNSNNLWVTGEWFIGTLPTHNVDLTTYPLLNPGGGAYYDDTYNGYDDGMIAKFSLTSFTSSLISIESSGCACNGKLSGEVDFNSNCNSINYTWGSGADTLLIGGNSSMSDLCAGDYWVVITDECKSRIDTLYTSIEGENIVESPLVIPNTFTPNDDGENDVFKPFDDLSVKYGELDIYNRWGQLISSTNIQQGWDGRKLGKPSPEGSYFWVVNYMDQCGEVKKLNGSLLLTR